LTVSRDKYVQARQITVYRHHHQLPGPITTIAALEITRWWGMRPHPHQQQQLRRTNSTTVSHIHISVLLSVLFIIPRPLR